MDGLLSELSPTAFTEIKHCCAYYRWVKNLEDTKGQSEAVNGRRTDNSMDKRMKIPRGQSEAVNGRKTDNSTIKRMKIPKGQSEAVNGRRTDNSTVKRMKILKGQSEGVNRGVKLVNGILPLPLLLIGSITATDIHSC